MTGKRISNIKKPLRIVHSCSHSERPVVTGIVINTHDRLRNSDA